MAKKRPLAIGCCNQMDWEVEDGFRTLCRAKEIQKDTKLMAKIKEYAKQKMTETASVVSECE